MNLMTYEPIDFIDRFFVNSPIFERGQEKFNWTFKERHEELKVNIIEAPENYTLTAEVPGLKEEDIDLEVKDGVLTLKTHRKQEQESNSETYRVREFSERRFERSFKLSDTVEQKNITAKLQNGLLRVTLPKREEVKARAVKIKVEH